MVCMCDGTVEMPWGTMVQQRLLAFRSGIVMHCGSVRISNGCTFTLMDDVVSVALHKALLNRTFVLLLQDATETPSWIGDLPLVYNNKVRMSAGH
eukprot:5007471-Amphidinium_carterae.1